jgi:hypothetical protein
VFGIRSIASAPASVTRLFFLRIWERKYILVGPYSAVSLNMACGTAFEEQFPTAVLAISALQTTHRTTLKFIQLLLKYVPENLPNCGLSVL